jgi:hypothetical protein
VRRIVRGGPAPTLRSVRPGTTSPTQKVENRLIAKLCRSTQFRGCHAIASTERAVKIGQIPEPDIERNRADLLVGMEGIRQQPVRADKALREHILSEGRAGAFEQPLAISAASRVAPMASTMRS